MDILNDFGTPNMRKIYIEAVVISFWVQNSLSFFPFQGIALLTNKEQESCKMKDNEKTRNSNRTLKTFICTIVLRAKSREINNRYMIDRYVGR